MAPWRASAFDVRCCCIEWRSSTSVASRRAGMPTPVEDFRHRLAPRRREMKVYRKAVMLALIVALPLVV
jgi:hypothetical protein